MKAEVGSELAILLQVVDQRLLQRLDFLMALEQAGVNLADRNENHVAKLLPEQARQGNDGGQAQAVEAADQQHRGGRVGVEFLLGLVVGGKQLRDQFHLQ